MNANRGVAAPSAATAGNVCLGRLDGVHPGRAAQRATRGPAMTDVEGSKSDEERAAQLARGPRTSRPGSAPVGLPSRLITSPATMVAS